MPSAPPVSQRAALLARLILMEVKFRNPGLLAELNPAGRLLVARCLRAARKDVE